MKFSGAQGSRRGRVRERSAKKSSTRFGGRHDLSPGRHSRRLVGIIPIRQKTGCYTCDGERAENVHATDRHCGARESAGAPRCGVRFVSADARAHALEPRCNRVLRNRSRRSRSQFCPTHVRDGREMYARATTGCARTWLCGFRLLRSQNAEDDERGRALDGNYSPSRWQSLPPLFSRGRSDRCTSISITPTGSQTHSCTVTWA